MTEIEINRMPRLILFRSANRYQLLPVVNNGAPARKDGLAQTMFDNIS
jgi:hypothetical protein